MWVPSVAVLYCSRTICHGVRSGCKKSGGGEDGQRKREARVGEQGRGSEREGDKERRRDRQKEFVCQY